MSNTSQIIPERARDIGDFLVGRLLPFRKKRMVGPFIFIDHMGPSEIGPGKYMDIGQHPHIGLSTLTYLFQGEIIHRDTVGSHQRITPGSVNWMTAGRGVVHTERTPEDHRDGKVREVHGFQIWVALPKDQESIDPSFQHVPAEELPRWSENGLNFKLVAGEGYGRKSPVHTYSPLFMVEITADETTELNLKGEVNGEVGICVVKGSVSACGELVSEGSMLVSKIEDSCLLTVHSNTHILLFGGEPLTEERLINWNFVATEQYMIDAARENWKAGKFEMIPDGGNVVPLPGQPTAPYRPQLGLFNGLR